jgi:hypothetical protein
MRINRRSDDNLVMHDGEPWGLRLWLGLALVAVVAIALQTYGIGRWPMADDEVPSLVEQGLLDVGAKMFSVPEGQVGRLPRTLVVWYSWQRFAIDLLPKSEISYRVPSVFCGVLTSVLAFLVAARWRGLWFAAALGVLLNFSQPFVYLAQLNRFYAMPLLMLALTLVAMWLPGRHALMAAVVAVLAVLSVLSHNMIVSVFLLAFIAAGMTYVAGLTPRHLLVRSGIAAAIGLSLYLGYIRPLVSGWLSTGNPTPVLVSFAAHAGMPALALSAWGAWLALTRWRENGVMIWWLLMFIGSFCLFQIATVSWNPRYFIFFMPAMWMLGAQAMTYVASRVGAASTAAVWYGVVALLFAPSMISHFQDGSRHDYRQATAVLVRHVDDGQPILSDDAETISYYLPMALRERLLVRTKVVTPPPSEFFLVARANAWMDQPTYPGRRVELLAEIRHRRLDQFSHILRVYRIAAIGASRP